MADKNKVNKELMPSTQTSSNEDFQILPQKEGQEFEFKTVRRSMVWLWAATAVFIIGGLYGGLYYYRTQLKNEIVMIDSQLVTIEKSRNQALENELLDFQRRLQIISFITERHVYDSKVLEYLQRLVKPEVRLTNLSISADENSVTFDAGAPSLDVLSQQISIFHESEDVIGVTLGGIDVDEASREVLFGLKLILDKSVFINSDG